MIKYILLALSLSITVLQATFMERMGHEVKEFRTYPRIQKAQNLIAKGELKEAKVLLEKVLSIDPKEEQSAQILAGICLELEDRACLKQYTFVQTIDADKLSDTSQRNTLRMIQLRTSILLGKKSAVANKLPKMMKHYAACSNERIDTISLLLEHHMIHEALPYIQNFKNACRKIKKDQKKLLVWADILKDNNHNPEALSLLASLPESVTKEETLLSLLIKNKEYNKALQAMEKIYQNEPNGKNTERLAYLYGKTKQYKHLKKLYIDQYKKKPDPEILKHILYNKKSGEADTSYLEAYYPYKGLSQKEKFNFAAELIKKYQKEGKKSNIASILHDLSEMKHLDIKENEYLSHAYLQNGNLHNAIVFMEKVYDAHPGKKYRKKLLYLYAKAGEWGMKQESLLLSSSARECDAETIGAILDFKHKSKRLYAKLENYLPFSCVKEKTKRNAAQSLAAYYRKTRQTGKLHRMYNLLAKDTTLSSDALLDIAYFFRHEGNMQMYRALLKKVSQKNPHSYTANLALGEYAYKQKAYKPALSYFKKAYRLNPKKKLLMRTIGELYLKTGQEAQALKSWKTYIKYNPKSDVTLQSARLLLNKGNTAGAKHLLNLFTHIPKNEATTYYTLKGDIANAESRHMQALKAYTKALKYAPSDVNLLYKSALLHEKTGTYPKAVANLKKIIPLVSKEEKEKYYAQIGFWAQKHADHSEAVDAFSYALQYRKSANYYKALAYSQFKLNRRERSVTNYKNALDTLEEQKLGTYSEKYAIKQSIAYMEKRFSGYFAFVSGNQDTTRPSTLRGENTLGGYSALRLNYAPISDINRFQVYLSTAVGVKNKSTSLAAKSTQPGIGVSYQVSKDTMVVIAVEKLIKGGSESRDDVLARISGEFFDNYSFDTQQKDKWFKHLYIDLAYFFGYDSYRFYTKYEHGFMHYVSQSGAWMPYMTTALGVNNDNTQKDRMYNFDLGLGLSYLFWLDEGRYSPHQYTGRASMEARHSLKTNYDQKNLVQLMLEVLF